MEAFDLNVADARWLIRTAELLSNQRVNRMRRELRTKVGEALQVNLGDRDGLDCVENSDLFIVIKPSATIDRAHMKTLDPLLRQSVVAAAAALETYVADEVSRRIAVHLVKGSSLPAKLAGLSISVGDWKMLEDNYTRRRRAIRENLLEPKIRELASTAPSQIGLLLGMLGVKDWSRKVDSSRHVPRTTTVKELDDLTKRRNRIAHEGDRRGYGRAAISVAEASRYADVVDSVALALEDVLNSI